MKNAISAYLSFLLSFQNSVDYRCTAGLLS